MSQNLNGKWFAGVLYKEFVITEQWSNWSYHFSNANLDLEKNLLW